MWILICVKIYFIFLSYHKSDLFYFWGKVLNLFRCVWHCCW